MVGHTSPKRERGFEPRTSLALRASVSRLPLARQMQRTLLKIGAEKRYG
jgi:hypothetical protein